MKIFDLYGFMTQTVNQVLTTGQSAGIDNVIFACGATGGCGSSLFWDGIHPTTVAHSLLAQQNFALAVPEPSEIAMMLIGLLVVVGASRRKAA